ncbi:Right handed beta helix region [bacterium A37T11]|nr:Right handed beta helix region [bacterium A37T11]
MIHSKNILIGLCLCLFSVQVHAQIFVAPDGRDTNDGTKEQPLASLKAARDKIRSLKKQGHANEPLIVSVSPGEYLLNEPLQLGPDDGGTDGNPVIYRGQPGGKVVFYGGTFLPSFEKVNDHLWRCLIPDVRDKGSRFEQLYVNGQRARVAGFPNSGFFTPGKVTEKLTVDTGGRAPEWAVQKIALRPEQLQLMLKIPEKDLENGILTLYHKWDNTRKRISYFSARDSALYITGQGMKPWNKLDSESFFTLTNVKAGLDTAGEWYLEDSGYLYYVPRAGETLANTRAFTPLLSQVIQLGGSADNPLKNVRFEGLVFEGAGYHMPEKGDEPSQAAAQLEAAIMIDFAGNITFSHCELAHTGAHGIWFRKGCFDSNLEHCYLHDLGAGAVKIGELKQSQPLLTRNIRVDNNILRSGGHIFACAVAVTIFNAKDNQVTHNEIADFNYSGVSVGWVWGYDPSPSKNNHVEYNHIHHLGWGIMSDMGGVYTLGLSEGTTVSNNVIHHIYAHTYGGWGLYTDEGSTGVLMENNLVYACKSSAFHQHYGQNNRIRNNIFYNQLRAQLEATKVEPHVGFRFTHNIVQFDQGDLIGIRWTQVNMQADSNVYWDSRGKDIIMGKMSFKQWQATGKDVHSLVVDPRFADAAHLDFTVKGKKLLRKIGFKPFDYSKAGVYGDDAWLKLAAFDPARAALFDQLVNSF